MRRNDNHDAHEPTGMMHSGLGSRTIVIPISTAQILCMYSEYSVCTLVNWTEVDCPNRARAGRCFTRLNRVCKSGRQRRGRGSFTRKYYQNTTRIVEE